MAATLKSAATIVLASASPRRRGLLREAGFRVRVLPANIDEFRRRGESPSVYARRLAGAKAAAAATRALDTDVVLGADTVVAIGERIFGKPASQRDAARILRALSGRRHRVLTAVCLVCRGLNYIRVALASTSVEMRKLMPSEIAAYIRTGEPYDKAGAYAIQGGAAAFIRRMDGSFTNVVGLPMDLVGRMWRNLERARTRRRRATLTKKLTPRAKAGRRGETGNCLD